MSNGYGDTHVSPHTLAGATILQIVPALREEPVARTAVNVAYALLQSGARALVAADDGPLVSPSSRLSAANGSRWSNDTVNPFKLARGARRLEQLIASERIDIVHAQSIGGAWIANMAAAQIAVWLVTTLPDVPAVVGLRAYWAGALARGDRVITPSNFAAAPVMARYDLPRERLTVIPRSIDTAAFDPAAVEPERIEALRKAWRIPQAARILLVPGRVAPWNGQAHPARRRTRAARRRRARVRLRARRRASAVIANMRASSRSEAKAKGVQALIRLTGHCRDMPAALAAADTVVVPAIEPPVLGRVVAKRKPWAGRSSRPTSASCRSTW